MPIPHLKLISFTLCPYVQRAMIVLYEKNISFDIEYIDLSEPPPWFYDISPLEKVPVLLVDDEPLFESMVICEYLDEITEGSLYPDDAFKRAQNRAWIEFGNDILSTTFEFYTTEDEKRFKHLTNTLVDRFEILEDEISDGIYFNGEEFSMIDAVYAPVFRYHNRIAQYKNFGFFDDAPKINAWGDKLLERPSVIQSVPDTYEQDTTNYIKKLDSVFSKEVGDKLK
ncbi:MAG: glutathione S-transferase family protein [Gammaproteobacteria bacterium]|nr:glutathione S-transferase family protein [Gammaproteobacteria bacterium]